MYFKYNIRIPVRLHTSHMSAWNYLCPLPSLRRSSSFFFPPMFLQVLVESPYFTTADYFSLGVIVYEMTFNRHPFCIDPNDIRGFEKRVLYEKPHFPETIEKHLYDFLDRVSSIHRAFPSLKELNPFQTSLCWVASINGKLRKLKYVTVRIQY